MKTGSRFAKSRSSIRGFGTSHDMRTRSSGPYSFIQIHMEMDKMLTLNEAHEISDDVMYNVEREFPNAEVLIHLDPEGIEERRDEL